MPIQVNNLDTRVLFQRKSIVQDAVYGTEVITWVTVATVWAEVQDVLPTRSQAEQMRGDIQVAVSRSRVRMRYRTDINATMRCIIGGLTFQVVSEPAEIGRHEYMELIIERAST